MESIDVRQLGPQFTEFHWNEPAAALGLDAEPEFQFPVTIDVKARCIAKHVMVTGKMGSRVRLECRKCLQPFEKNIEAEVVLEFLEDPQVQEQEDAVAVENKDVNYYTAPFVDLSDDLRQILLIAAPAYPVCREDCRGLCPTCGADRNTATCGCQPSPKARPFEALGALLQKEREGHG